MTTPITTTTTDMVDTLHPHLLWVQDDSYIHVTVEIENCGPCSFEVGNRLYLETVSNTTKKQLIDTSKHCLLSKRISPQKMFKIFEW